MYHGCAIIRQTNLLFNSIKVIIVVIRQRAEPWKHIPKVFPFEKNEEIDFFFLIKLTLSWRSLHPSLRSAGVLRGCYPWRGHSGELKWKKFDNQNGF